jgi:hypothetical protein
MSYFRIKWKKVIKKLYFCWSRTNSNTSITRVLTPICGSESTCGLSPDATADATCDILGGLRVEWGSSVCVVVLDVEGCIVCSILDYAEIVE